MGLLDDAIREHLELKRRHGADLGEVQRLEEEAFGPPRSAADVGAGDLEPVLVELPEAGADEPGVEPSPEVHEAVPVVPEEPELQIDAPIVDPVGFDDEPWLDEPDEVPFGESLERPERTQPTSEFSPEEAAAATGATDTGYVAPDEEAGDDLLEETPDFLQETPEHDRLWFEQKPPKDFDFGS